MSDNPEPSVAKQIAELRALIEDIHQAVAAAPRYRGVPPEPSGVEYERAYKAWRETQQ